MKEITAENKFLAGVKNQCSVRKAGIGKPEQGVRQKSSKFFCVRQLSSRNQIPLERAYSSGI
jgi:hypothetical protein